MWQTIPAFHSDYFSKPLFISASKNVTKIALLLKTTVYLTTRHSAHGTLSRLT